MNADVDCLVIGGGPAGLTAALYLARFRLDVAVVDTARSRLSVVPRIHNLPGFDDGISGASFLDRLRAQAMMFGAKFYTDRIGSLARPHEGRPFSAYGSGLVYTARSVLLATGVRDRRPSIDTRIHDDAVQAGRLRYCPVCDGYEAINKHVAVIGNGANAVAECRFLRTYTDRLCLLIDPSGGLAAAGLRELGQLGVPVTAGPARDFRLESNGLSFECATGRLSFEAVYVALGAAAQSDLASAVGARCNADGAILTDRHQRTSVASLYAAGDVVAGLNQISAAMGQAAIAATAVRNDLQRM